MQNNSTSPSPPLGAVAGIRAAPRVCPRSKPIPGTDIGAIGAIGADADADADAEAKAGTKPVLTKSLPTPCPSNELSRTGGDIESGRE